MKLVDFDRQCFCGESEAKIKVTCRTAEQASLWLSPGSILARSEEEYLEILKKLKLVPGKEYLIKSVDGCGDMFDVTVEIDGEDVDLMSSFFIDTYCDSTKFTFNDHGKRTISYIEDTEYYAQWIERIKKMDPNVLIEKIYLTPTA